MVVTLVSVVKSFWFFSQTHQRATHAKTKLFLFCSSHRLNGPCWISKWIIIIIYMHSANCKAYANIMWRQKKKQIQSQSQRPTHTEHTAYDDDDDDLSRCLSGDLKLIYWIIYLVRTHSGSQCSVGEWMPATTVIVEWDSLVLVVVCIYLLVNNPHAHQRTAQGLICAIQFYGHICARCAYGRKQASKCVRTFVAFLLTRYFSFAAL